MSVSRRAAISRISIAGLLALLGATATSANVTAPLFQDHMVLQRRMPVPIFGSADAGETVTVSFRGQEKSAKAGADGRWTVKLDPMEAGGPFELTLKGKNTLTLADVMVGEVWLASGQSNMARTLKQSGGPHLDTAKAATLTGIRAFTMTKGSKARWGLCTLSTALDFSATAYYFGKDLHKTLGVPVGLIASAVGGTPIERWLDLSAVPKDSELAKDTTANDLYRKWIRPLQPMAIRGVIWYQGESNALSSGTYQRRFAFLIDGWRKAWGQGDFPFHYVQLAAYRALQTAPGDTSRFAEIREDQRKTLAKKNTGMAVTIDIGDAGDVHPINKWDVGKRLALPVRYNVYGRKSDSAFSGPLFDTCFRVGRTVHVLFDHAHGGLQAKGGVLKGFAVAGADRKWHWAQAAIHGDTVRLSSPEVAEPAHIRHAYASNPIFNFYNGAGLPASPFEEVVPKPVGTALAASRDFAPSPAPRVPTDALGRNLAPTAQRPGAALPRKAFPKAP